MYFGEGTRHVVRWDGTRERKRDLVFCRQRSAFTSARPTDWTWRVDPRLWEAENKLLAQAFVSFWILNVWALTPPKKTTKCDFPNERVTNWLRRTSKSRVGGKEKAGRRVERMNKRWCPVEYYWTAGMWWERVRMGPEFPWDVDVITEWKMLKVREIIRALERLGETRRGTCGLKFDEGEELRVTKSKQSKCNDSKESYNFLIHCGVYRLCVNEMDWMKVMILGNAETSRKHPKHRTLQLIPPSSIFIYKRNVLEAPFKQWLFGSFRHRPLVSRLRNEHRRQTSPLDLTHTLTINFLWRDEIPRGADNGHLLGAGCRMCN